MKVFAGDNLRDHERNFNRHVRRTRQIIERTIGVLKSRFRCISSECPLRYQPTKACRIVYSCATLHNYLIHNNFNIMNGINENRLNRVMAEQRLPIVDNANANMRRGVERRNAVSGFFNQQQQG